MNEIVDPNDPSNYYVQEANQRARTAQAHERDARADLEVQRHANSANIDLIVQLRDRVARECQRAEALERERARLQSEVDELASLLALPLQEIAGRHARFRTTFEGEQLILAKWILSQKAYAETALHIGVRAGMTSEAVQAMYKDSIVSVLANATRYGNDAVTNPVLKANIDKIVASAGKRGR
jgi:hypothetical protein